MNNAFDVTLKDLLPMAKGSIEILNECKETLVRMVDVSMWVLPIESVLSDELLKREVLELNSDGVLTITVKGMEDAE